MVQSVVAAMMLMVGLVVGSFTTTSSTVAAGDGWRRVDEGVFSFSLPPDMERVPVQGIDSRVGQFRGPLCTLSFDYGFYSTSFPETARQPDYRESTTAIDGRAARILTATYADRADGLRYFAGLAIADVGVPARPPFGPTKLSMSVSCSAPEGQEIAVRIFDSLAFPD
jgi:hypothetical protein